MDLSSEPIFRVVGIATRKIQTVRFTYQTRIRNLHGISNLSKSEEPDGIQGLQCICGQALVHYQNNRSQM